MKEYIISVDESKKDIMGGMPLTNKPQEFVRCKDCKYLDSEWDYCPKLDKDDVEPDWFCADGERREGE